MKILKVKSPDIEERQVECIFCGSTLEIDKYDIVNRKEIWISKENGENELNEDAYDFYVCPVCEKENILPENYFSVFHDAFIE